METEEKRDLSIAILLGGLIGGLIVFFSQTLPHFGLSDSYIAIQMAVFGLLVGVLPLRAYFGSSPQGILVSAAVSVTTGMIFVAVLASGAVIWLKLITAISVAVGGISTYFGFLSAAIPNYVLHLGTIMIVAWILSFGVVILFGLVLGGAGSILTWIVSVGVTITFAVLFDSIGEEMNTVPNFSPIP